MSSNPRSLFHFHNIALKCLVPQIFVDSACGNVGTGTQIISQEKKKKP